MVKMVVKKIKFLENKENLIISFAIFGILLLSLGVYLVGSRVSFGSTVLTLGSGIFYVSVIFFVFLFA